MKEQDNLKNELRMSGTVMVVLVAVNVIEFWFALAIKSQLVLFSAVALLAIIDSGLILIYYMHILRLFDSNDEGSHS